MTPANATLCSNYNHIIFAPHPDDEVIGCFELFQLPTNICVVLSPDICKSRMEESLHYSKINGHVLTVMNTSDTCITPFELIKLFDGIKLIQPRFNTKPDQTIFWFPDPAETPLLHKKMSSYMVFVKNIVNIGVYSTTMTTSYTRECSDPEKKKATLNRFFKSQQSLWKYEHKYFLYEGRMVLL